MKKIIISAVSLNNVIGLNNNIPWENLEELKYFKETTLNHAVLMGRKTFDSIGKPLLQRINLVISRNKKEDNKTEELFYFSSIEDAINYAESIKIKKLFIIGGNDVYSQIINKADELLISRMPFEIEGNKYFPEINSSIWGLRKVKKFKSFKVERYKKF